MSEDMMRETLAGEITYLRAENERLKAALRGAAESVLAEFEEDLTRQQRDYIVDQVIRRVALEGVGGEMAPDEAYRRGQRDMRDRIIRQWSGWITNSIGGYWRATRLGRKGYSNVAVEIRARCKVLPLREEGK